MRTAVKYVLCFAILGLMVGLFFVSRKEQTGAPVAVTKSERKTVCLNMIVKNETAVIKRCLSSVLPMIDYWVIVDTGSTDGTQAMIKEFMKEKGVQGELHERPWVNFSHNRNEALALAKNKADYVMFIDADEYFTYAAGFTRPTLDKDYYFIELTAGGVRWPKIHLVNNKQDWAWVGVLHEVISPPADRIGGMLDKITNIYTSDGARSKDPKKYEKDAEILEAALKDEPNNSRYIFYLGSSYLNAHNHAKALENFQKRADMSPGYDSEAFLSLINMGICQEALKMPPDTIIATYKRAICYNRARAESYYHLANYYRNIGDFQHGYEVAKIGMTLPLVKDILFVQEWMYNWGLLLEYSICAYWIDRFDECQLASLALLKKTSLPEHVREVVERNLGFANQKLLEKVTASNVKN